MQESVLVTGGAGYIGSHAVAELAQAAASPRRLTPRSRAA